MALFDPFPAQSGVADQIEIRKALAGLLLRDTSGNARPGLWPRNGTTAVVTARSDMQVDVAAFLEVLVRAGGPVFGGNDGTVQVALAAAPGANSRYDVVYKRQNENGYGGLADGSNGPVLGVQQGTASASPNKATVLAAIPAGAIPLASILVPSGVSATNAGGVVITQEFQWTALTGTPIPVRSKAELDLLTTYQQGTLGRDLVTQILYGYFAAFDATTNPSGAKTAGWYPVPGGAEYGGKVVHGASSPTWVAADTLIGGAGVWSATAVGAAKENGIAAFGTGTPANSGWTCSLDGVYRISAVIHGTSAGGNGQGALILKKNNNTAGGTGGLVAVGDINGGYLTGDITTELELVSGDYVTLSHFNGGSSATMALGAASEELQFGIQFVRPIRHA